jgi:hypothetical protein
VHLPGIVPPTEIFYAINDYMLMSHEPCAFTEVCLEKSSSIAALHMDKQLMPLLAIKSRAAKAFILSSLLWLR